MERLKILAIAVATGRIGYVYLLGDRLKDWGMSRKASKNTAAAAAQTKSWIAALEPDVVVTENMPKTSTKSVKTRALIEAITKVASDAELHDVQVQKPRSFKNKYEEAASLGQRFPEIAIWVPKMRRLWEPEPRATVLFEALAMASVVMDERSRTDG